MIVENGRPADISGRLDKEIQSYDFLDTLGITYDRVDHEAAFTMEACNAVSEALGIMICKNLFLCNRQKTDFYLLIMPADKPFKTKEITGQLGCSRLSFADEHSLLQLLNLTPGSATILGLMNDIENKVRLLVDSDLLDEEYFGRHPCINTSSLKIKTSDIFGKITKALKHEYTIVTLTGD